MLCAVAPTVEFLIGARALQGVAGALLVPGSLAIVAATFEGAARGKAVGTWTAWTGIATVLGPAGGGALIGLTSWRAIFWVNLPLIAVTVALTLHAVEESRDPDAFRGIDWAGIVLSAVGLGGPVFALIEQPAHGWGDPMVWVPMVAGIVCFGLFVLREARARHPMLDLSLFRIRNFAVANLTTLDRLRGADRRPLLRQPLPPAGRRLLGARGRAWRRPRSRCCCSSSRRASAGSPRGPGRGCRCALGPIVGGIGLLLLLRVGADADYVDRRAARACSSSASASRRRWRR